MCKTQEERARVCIVFLQGMFDICEYCNYKNIKYFMQLFLYLKSMVASNALLKKQSQSLLNEAQHNLHKVKLANIQVCKSVQSHLGAILED